MGRRGPAHPTQFLRVNTIGNGHHLELDRRSVTARAERTDDLEALESAVPLIVRRFRVGSGVELPAAMR
jgi:hypothetical protein